jgi:glycosyltransferase involved in cell wall biosynthesis
MKASLLFVTYRHEAFVAEAIRSAMAQEYPQLELVVCDDGSPDRTREILEKELEDCPPHIEVVWASQKENRGFHENFNCGLKSCTGDVIVAMSGDDVSAPHRVSRICREFAADPTCMLVCSGWRKIDDTGKDLGRRNNRQRDGVFPSSRGAQEIYAGAPICGATAAYRVQLRDLFPPMAKGPHAEDNCFWFRARLIGTIHYIAEPLVLWRTHTSNESNWERTSDTANAREKHLKFLHIHQCMAPQWRRDLSHARATDMVSKQTFEILNRSIDMKREWARLIRLSVLPAPWRLWFGSACRLLRMSSECGKEWTSLRKILRRHAPIRISRKRREKYWKSYFNNAHP